jgi:hypothetical protein
MPPAIDFARRLLEVRDLRLSLIESISFPETRRSYEVSLSAVNMLLLRCARLYLATSLPVVETSDTTTGTTSDTGTEAADDCSLDVVRDLMDKWVRISPAPLDIPVPEIAALRARIHDLQRMSLLISGGLACG